MIEIDEEQMCSASAQEIYQWICDIENYKTWIPHCSDSGIIKFLTDQSHEAYIHMDLGLWTEKLVTHNIYTPHTKIEMHLITGPFQAFKGQWTLEALGDHRTKVQLQIQATLRFAFLEPGAQWMIQGYRGRMIDLLYQRFGIERGD